MLEASQGLEDVSNLLRELTTRNTTHITRQQAIQLKEAFTCLICRGMWHRIGCIGILQKQMYFLFYKITVSHILYKVLLLRNCPSSAYWPIYVNIRIVVCYLILVDYICLHTVPCRYSIWGVKLQIPLTLVISKGYRLDEVIERIVSENYKTEYCIVNLFFMYLQTSLMTQCCQGVAGAWLGVGPVWRSGHRLPPSAWSAGLTVHLTP